MSKILLIHWDPDECASLAYDLEQAGYAVETEAEDGASAAKLLITTVPRAIVISLRRLPNHGWATAVGLESYRAGRHTPIVFFDGSPAAVETVQRHVPRGIFTTWESLPSTLEELLG